VWRPAQKYVEHMEFMSVSRRRRVKFSDVADTYLNGETAKRGSRSCYSPGENLH